MIVAARKEKEELSTREKKLLLELHNTKQSWSKDVSELRGQLDSSAKYPLSIKTR
jgi:hypothetical protein